MKLKRTGGTTSPSLPPRMPPPGVGISSSRSTQQAPLPDFFRTLDAAALQEHLIRSHPPNGAITHFVAVSMDQLPQFVQRRDIDESAYIWDLRGMSCGRLRHLGARLGISGIGSASIARCLQEIAKQPGNRTFDWERFKEAAFAARRPTRSVQPEVPLSASATTPTTSTPSPRKKARLARDDRRAKMPPENDRRAKAPPGDDRRAKAVHTIVRRAVRTDAPPQPAPPGGVAHTHLPPEEAVDTAPAIPTGHTMDTFLVSRPSWDTVMRITEQHRRSLEQKRNQEFAYYRELAPPHTVSDVVRRYMLGTLESIQASIQREERVLKRWLDAQYADGMFRRETRGNSHSITPPARAALYKTTNVDDNDDE
jgi:hypothetical protein